MAHRNYLRARRRDSNAWKKPLIAMLLAAGCLALLWSLIMGEMGLVKYSRMRSQANSLAADIDRLKQDNVRLMTEVRALKYDPAYLERLARDKLGFARPGEIVYYYSDVGERR